MYSAELTAVADGLAPIRSAHSPRPSGADAKAAGEKIPVCTAGIGSRDGSKTLSPAKADTRLRRELLPAEDGTLLSHRSVTGVDPPPSARRAHTGPSQESTYSRTAPPPEGTAEDAVVGGRRGRGKDRFRIRTLFVDERRSQAIAYFLATTDGPEAGRGRRPKRGISGSGMRGERREGKRLSSWVRSVRSARSSSFMASAEEE